MRISIPDPGENPRVLNHVYRPAPPQRVKKSRIAGKPTVARASQRSLKAIKPSTLPSSNERSSLSAIQCRSLRANWKISTPYTLLVGAVVSVGAITDAGVKATRELFRDFRHTAKMLALGRAKTCGDYIIPSDSTPATEAKKMSSRFGKSDRRLRRQGVRVTRAELDRCPRRLSTPQLVLNMEYGEHTMAFVRTCSVLPIEPSCPCNTPPEVAWP